jgi:hypothetical protein
MSNEEKLLELARAKFGELKPVEEKLFRAVAKGEVADFQVGDEEIDHPSKAESWGTERTLQADRIAWLCTDKEASLLVTYKGLDIKGAKVIGDLNLAFSLIPFPFKCSMCRFPDKIDLSYAKLSALYLSGSSISSFSGSGIQIEHDALFDESFEAHEEVDLTDAKIGGNLLCQKGHFLNRTGVAINAHKIQVGGILALSRGFEAKGEVSLVEAKILA